MNDKIEIIFQVCLAIAGFVTLIILFYSVGKCSGITEIVNGFTSGEIYFILIEYEDKSRGWITSDDLKNFENYTIIKEVKI